MKDDQDNLRAGQICYLEKFTNLPGVECRLRVTHTAHPKDLYVMMFLGDLDKEEELTEEMIVAQMRKMGWVQAPKKRKKGKS